jgi:hypothetical protein
VDGLRSRVLCGRRGSSSRTYAACEKEEHDSYGFIDVVNQSSGSIVAEDTEGLVWRDWKSFFNQFKIREMPDLMKQHVFHFRKDDPLMVHVHRKRFDS